MSIPYNPTQPQTVDEKKTELKRIEDLHNFYKPMFKNRKFAGLDFKKVEFLELLKSFGFYCYDIDATHSKFVILKNNLIREIPEKYIQTRFINYVDELPDLERITIPDEEYIQLTSDDERTQYIQKIGSRRIKEALLNKLDNLFRTKLLYCLSPEKPIEIQTDEKTCKYLYYSNGFIKVTANNIEFSNYDKLTKCIWANSVLDRPYQQPDGQTAVFEKFTRNICRVLNDNETLNERASDDRFLSLKTIIGYNMHGYTRYKLYATLLTDSRMDEDGEANGRSGKTLLTKAIGKMLNTDEKSTVYVEINGKNFDLRNNARYSKCSIDTQLVNINDAVRHFPIESVFNDITEGIEVKRLYENPFVIYSKMIITSNQTIKIEGDSAKDRTLIFELSDYYTANRSPLTEFGHWFFDEWTPDEWMRFDNFMIECIKCYFANGIIRSGLLTLEKRMLRDHTDPDFLRWATYKFRELDDEGHANFDRIIINEKGTNPANRFRYVKRDIFDNFKRDYPDFERRKNFSQRKFTMWLKMYIKFTYFGTAYFEEIRSNGFDYFFVQFK